MDPHAAEPDRVSHRSLLRLVAFSIVVEASEPIALLVELAFIAHATGPDGLAAYAAAASAWEFCCTRSCEELWRAMARRQASAPVIATVGLGTKGWLCGWSRSELWLPLRGGLR